MIVFEMTSQFLSSGELTIASDTPCRQKLLYFSQLQQIFATIVLDSLVQLTMNVNDGGIHAGAVLRGTMVLFHVLLQAMLRGVSLEANWTRDGFSWSSLWNFRTLTCE